MSMEVLFIKFKAVTPIFWISIALVSLFIIWGAFFPENVGNVLSVINNYISNNFGWFYLLVTKGFVILALFLLFVPYGKMYLVNTDLEPYTSYIYCIALLISEGMLIGFILFILSVPMIVY